ncbi:MAG: hypothetical protein ABEH38_01630, partial [Flavobacteriales bacterium]
MSTISSKTFEAPPFLITVLGPTAIGKSR